MTILRITACFRLFFLLPAFFAVLTISSYAQIYEPDGVRMPGDWNSWDNTTGMGGDFDLQKNSTGTLRWQTIFNYTGVSGAQEFKFVSTSFADPWGNQWAGNASVSINSFADFTYGTPSEPNNKINLVNNKWYTVIFEDQAYANTRAIFMQTSAEPVNLTTVFQHPLLVTSLDIVNITLQLSANPSPEEKFYLRYSIDNWVTSAVSSFSVTGTEGIAQIPPLPDDTTVRYYVFSTVINNPQQDFDLVTIRMNNNNGLNYSYTVGQTINCGEVINVVSTQPALPLDTSNVLVIFNATLGNGGLYNFTGDVYAHTGVITNLSTSNTDWRYVKTEWGENTPETKLLRTGDNMYQLNIGSIRAYYGVPASETILKMAFVFRGGEPNPEGNYPEHKNADGSDILTNVYPYQLTVKIMNPSSRSPLASPNEVMAVCVEALRNETISIYLDDVLLETETTSSLSYPLELQGMEPGTYWVKAVAAGNQGQARDSVNIYLRGPVVVEELPSGMKNGINYLDEHSVTLVLNDPAGLKQYAFAIGEFSNWLPNDANYMKRTPDGKNYWVTLTGLQSQKEYAYQYYIDGLLKVGDPYCDKILDPWNDRWIPATTYPDLKPYPFDQTTGPVSVFQTGQTDYPWVITSFVPPAVNVTQQDLLVYELLLRDFTEEKTLNAAIEKLDYLKDLGVNAVELMPIAEFDGNESWGYAPNFFFATDKFYGTKADYKKFIDACHQRDMAVVLDIVTNHSFGMNPLVQMYFDPLTGTGQPSASNPWLNPQSPHPLGVGYDFNHDSPHTREFFKQDLTYWLTEYKVDGFRFDLSKGLTQKYSGEDLAAWSAYDQSRIDILTDYYNHIKSVNPNAYVILEHFADNSEETVLANSGMLPWSAMNDQYGQVGMGWQENSDISWAYHGNRGWTYPNLMDYMENHDEERLMFEDLSWGNAAGSYNLKDTLPALHHMQTADVLFMGIPGPKMVWEFGELGYDYSIMFNGGRTANKPPRWDYFDQPERQELYRVYAGMAALRKCDAYRMGTFSSDLSGLGKRMWISHSSRKVVIAANMSVNDMNMSPGFPNTGQWFDYFSGEALNITDQAQSFPFAPGEYRVFTSTPLPVPYHHIVFTVQDSLTGLSLQSAELSLEGAGTQLTDVQGKATFTSFPGNLQVTAKKTGYKVKSQLLTVDNNLDVTILLKDSSNIGIQDINARNRVKLYPNPVRDLVYLEATQKYGIDFYSLDGRLLMHHQMQNLIERIDISGLDKGIYILRFTGDSTAFAVKLTVE